jgi:hypothetical protein
MPSLRPLRKRQERPSCLNARRRRLTKTKLAVAMCMAIYSIFIGTYHFKISRNYNFASSKNDIVSKSCWLSDSSRKKLDNSDKNTDGMIQGERSLQDADLFRILCTSTRKKIKWGSYQLRCRDLKAWAQKCTKNVHIVTGISFEDIHRLRWLRHALGQLAEEEKVTYNATIFVKSFPGKGKILPLYGNMFVDMGDEDIPEEMHLLLQTKRQGSQVFIDHNFSVVEHWYNSFPADMALLGPPEYVPPISHQSNISIATVWNTKRGKKPTEGGCPKVISRDVSYKCLDQPFDISTWYLKLFKEGKDKCEMEKTLANPRLGSGMLYYNVFRKFDALVVLAKNDTMKLEYGNVQRTVSQMRSGVPVLIEIRGRVLEDFAKHYNYTCTFQRYHDDAIQKRSKRQKDKYLSFHEAVLQLTRPEIRKQCQEQGLAIVKDYAPSRIAQKFLRAVGYPGDFLC